MYVPILGAEHEHLAGLAATSELVKGSLTPLFDVPAPADRDDDAELLLETWVEAIEHAWGRDRVAYLDCNGARGSDRLADGRVHLAYVLDAGRERGLPIVPVTGLRRSSAYQLAVADAAHDDGRGACLRLQLPDFQSPETVTARVEQFLETLLLAPERIDVVVDLDEIGPVAHALLEVTVRAVLVPLARLAPWRSLTLAGAAGLGHAGGNGAARTVARTEWLLWRALATEPVALGTSGARLRFGDYGRAAARGADRWLHYTHDAEWLVLDPADGPAVRALPRRPEFHGAAHCAGDACFAHLAAGQRPDPTVWRAAATTHHLTTVVEQIASA